MQNFFPVLRYDDARAAIAWLRDVLGFEELMTHEGDSGKIEHAQLGFEGGIVMLGSTGPGRTGPGGTLVYVATDGVDALYEQVKSKGAELEMDITDTDYGSRDFAVRDPEGNVWSFGTYRPESR
jgi:uncharacterized glyoxalase superfamily protein PhnB